MELIVSTHPKQNPEKSASRHKSFTLHHHTVALLSLLSPSIRLLSAGALFTHKLVHERRAAFALDVAAPVELAVAALVLVGLELIVTSAAAHQLAAVHALRGFVAEAALRAQGARGLVAEAVIRAGVDVGQVLRGWGVEALVDLLQLSLDEINKQINDARVFWGGCVFLFNSWSYEFNTLRPMRMAAALSYFSLRNSPTRLKSASWSQHVFRLHEPETP